MIRNLSDFRNQIKDIDEREWSSIFFRGHSDSRYNLIPSIYRDGLIENEDNIYKEIINLVPHEFKKCKTTIEKLVKMQHYGVPTRLLDITSNPLVALFFACSNNFDNDGEVIVFNIQNKFVKYFDSDSVSVIANIVKRPIDFNIDRIILDKTAPKADVSKFIEYFNDNIEIQKLCHEIRQEKPYFLNQIQPKTIGSILAVKVKMDNQRIIKQQGSFLIFGFAGSKERIPELYKYYFDNMDVRYIIPKEHKKRICKELESIGISENTLFPEIENQAKYLTNKYKKQRPPS